MTTDLNRLHHVITHRPRDRQIGRTYAACHNAAGILSTCSPNSTILWYIPTMSWTHHILPMLDRILHEHELEIELWSTTTRTLFCNGSKLRFISMSAGLDQTHVLQADYEVDDIGECADYMRRYHPREWERWLRS